MITSAQVSQMHMHSMQQNAGVPMPGMMAPQPTQGMSQYPPTFSYSMGGLQNPNERISNRLVGAGAGAVSGAVGAASALSGMAGLAAIPAGIAGMGIAGPLGVLGGFTVGGGLALMGAGVSSMAQGYQDQARVNQIFGNQQFANAANPYGRGFSRDQLRSLGRAVRAVDTEDPFVSMEDALRVTDRFGSQFGMAQGVKNAEKLAGRVKELGNTLAKMAKVLGTTIDEAGEIMSMSRGAGFYTSDDVMGNTQTFLRMRGMGFTSNQTGQIQQTGAAMSRSAGLSGRAGARFAAGMTEDIALLMNMGSEQVQLDRQQRFMDVTGAQDPNSAAAAFAQSTQQMFQNVAQNPVGQLMIAGMMTRGSDGSFTANQDTIRRLRSGQLGVDELRQMGQRNLQTSQDKVNFVEQQDLILGDLMQTEGSTSALINMIRRTAQDEGKPFEILVRQMTGRNARDVRLMEELANEASSVRTQRERNAMMELQAQRQQITMREGSVGGTMQYIKGSISDFFAPIKEAGADMLTEAAYQLEQTGIGAFNATVGNLVGRQVGLQGYRTTTAQAAELNRTLTAMSVSSQDPELLALLNVDEDQMRRIQGASTAMSSGERANLYSRMGSVGGLRGALRESLDPAALDRLKSSGGAEEIRQLTVRLHNAESDSERATILQQMRKAAARGSGIGFSSREVPAIAMAGHPVITTGGSPNPQLPTRTTTEHSYNLTGNEEALDALIAEVGGEMGLHAIRKGRKGAEMSGGGLFDTFNTQGDRLEQLVSASTGPSSGGVATAQMVGGGYGMVVGGIIGGVIGAVGGPAGIAAGVMIGGALGGGLGALEGTAAAHLYNFGGKDLRRAIREGKGVSLIAKASTAKDMKKIDRAIALAASRSDDPAERRQIAADLLNRSYPGMEIQADDIQVYEDAIGRATNTGSAMDRFMEAESNPDAYNTFATAAEETTSIAADANDTILIAKTVEQFQGAATRLAGDLTQLDGDLGAELGAVADASDALMAGGGIEDFQGNLADLIKATADSSITSDMVGGKSAETQVIVRAAEDLRRARQLTSEGDINVGRFLDEMGIDAGSAIGVKALRLAGESNRLSSGDVETLAAEMGASAFSGLTIEGTAAMSSAARQGKSQAQIAAENTQKAAEMIDALYAHMMKTEPIFADSGLVLETSPVGSPESS